MLEDINTNSVDPYVALNNRGEAIVVWVQERQGGSDLYGRYFSNGMWGPITLLEYSDGIGVGNPQVVLNDNGQGMVVWHQIIASYHVYARSFSNGNWGQVALLDTAQGHAILPQVAIDESGNATAVWRQGDAQYDVYANRYEAGSWQGPVALESLSTSADQPRIASNGGTTMAVWSQLEGGYYNLYASIFDGSWEQPVLLEEAIHDAFASQLDVDASGNATVVWQQSDGSYHRIHARMYSLSGWEETDQLENNVGDASAPQVAMKDGYSVVTWLLHDGSRYNVYASRYAEGGWGPATLLEDMAGEVAYYPQVTVSGYGEGVVAWIQAGSIYSNRLRWDTWGGTAVLASSINAEQLELATDGDGNTMAVWCGSNWMSSSKSIFASFLVGTLPLTLSVPSGGTVNTPTVLVIGTTSPRADLVINGFDVHVESNGSFSALIPLALGENVINATVTDTVFGSTNSMYTWVTYDDQLPSFKQTTESNGTLHLLIGLIGVVLAVVAILLVYMRTTKS